MALTPVGVLKQTAQDSLQALESPSLAKRVILHTILLGVTPTALSTLLTLQIIFISSA